ncbi:MAG: TspO/MBR family protein [Nanoarchaeota archaeon]
MVVKKGGNKIDWKVLIACIVILGFVGLTGSLFTQQSVGSEWYDSIKPSITPPDWVFPVVWNVLFFLIAVSLYFAFQASKSVEKKKMTALVYGINFYLNLIWSMLFFGFRNPLAAFYQIGLLWISIAFMIIYTWKIDRKASLLLVPYFLWVSFACYLNYLMI